ncbi:ChaN family lipoprotein [Accumulibacter sp.]|uniref:ChaN family lipoprotein n=1 Tax=Accumulibacter sp. TaxID=2053492 RepID=UPI0025E7294B|nr:ChaN family lipoprotein [Accumulibacter sp.]MCM8611098.1 ChaN family lipoprotein [Accumulibacter sp.]MCM8636212.1 ChaN family lipoprotein [Accumulibacter sp.]MCM8640611.1 ChaN family lipoprotein [Accumulibacter sp.]
MRCQRGRWPVLALLALAVAVAVVSLLPGSAAVPAACTVPTGWLRIVDGTAESAPANEVLARAAAADVVLLGEQHDDEDHHRWQAQVLAGLHALRPQMVVGFEMFPRRVQPVLDRWVAGELSAPALLAQTGWGEIWGFPAAFYQPLFEFARINRLPMLALNVDSRLTRAIGDKGWDAVPENEREGVGHAAPASEAYRDFLFSIYGEHAHGQGGRDSRDFRHFVEAQLNWDRAMAEALAARLASGQGDGRPPLVVGVIGSGHLRHGHGVPHQLRALGVGRVATLLPLTFADACREMQPGLADALFVLPSKPALPVPPPRLGVQLEDIGGAGSGVRVQAVTAGSLAEKSGLMAGDRLLEVAGRPADQAAAVIARVRAAAPGTWLPLRVGRGDTTLEIVVRLPPE